MLKMNYYQTVLNQTEVRIVGYGEERLESDEWWPDFTCVKP